MRERSVVQKPYPRECARRVRFEWAKTPQELHVIIEEEAHSGDGLFKDERARVTIPYSELHDAVMGMVEVVS